VRRLDAWLAASDLTDATVWAYGDSAGDRELLARADYPLFVKGANVSAVPAGFSS
jgi:phosphoserine phosphatase